MHLQKNTAFGSNELDADKKGAKKGQDNPDTAEARLAAYLIQRNIKARAAKFIDC
jgi:hypothetical protein